jgi:hypothetical protein
VNAHHDSDLADGPTFATKGDGLVEVEDDAGASVAARSIPSIRTAPGVRARASARDVV